MCGDHYTGGEIMSMSKGSPPHVRGPLEEDGESIFVPGITPACAGTTAMSIAGVYFLWDHPRMCGDHVPRLRPNGM